MSFGGAPQLGEASIQEVGALGVNVGNGLLIELANFPAPTHRRARSLIVGTSESAPTGNTADEYAADGHVGDSEASRVKVIAKGISYRRC